MKKRKKTLRKIKWRVRRKTEEIFERLNTERRKSRAKKVFDVLKFWLERGWILDYGEYPQLGYEDCILRQDGWFISSNRKMVNFRIKSSPRAVQRHKEECPEVSVIMVDRQIGQEKLDEKMQCCFKDNLPKG